MVLNAGQEAVAFVNKAFRRMFEPGDIVYPSGIRSINMAATLNRLSISDLHAEIRRRQRSTDKLQRRHAKVIAKARELEAQIQKLGGTLNGRVGGGPGSRVKNDLTLVESLAKTLKGKTLSVTDAAAAVQEGGYKTNSNNFRTQVNIALIKSGLFKRVGRGEYTTK